MVSSEDIRVRMARRPKTTLPVGKPGELTLFSRADIPKNMMDNMKMPFNGENVVLTTSDGNKVRLEDKTIPVTKVPVMLEKVEIQKPVAKVEAKQVVKKAAKKTTKKK